MEVVRELGNRVYIDTVELMVPSNEQAKFIIKLSEEDTGGKPAELKIKIIFDDDASEMGVKFTPSGDWSNMTLANWGNTLGTCLSTPYAIAAIENRFLIEMMMRNNKIGSTNCLTIQLWRRPL